MPADEIMRKFKHGTLHSGSSHGPKVTNPAQARAIAASYSEKERAVRPKKGKGRKRGGRRGIAQAIDDTMRAMPMMPMQKGMRTH